MIPSPQQIMGDKDHYNTGKYYYVHIKDRDADKQLNVITTRFV